MTRLERALVASFAGWIALAAASCTTETRPTLRAGVAAVDITPRDWPLPMIGSFRYRPATGAHDPLHSRALVLDDGTETVAIAVVDSCYIPRETLAAPGLASGQLGDHSRQMQPP